jgi:curved DNA-binding protein CbpA
LTVLKEKHNRLLDNLNQRLTLLDEANRMLLFFFLRKSFVFLDERDDFDKQTEQIQDFYQQLQNDFTKFKQQSSINDDSLSNERRLEQVKQFFKRLDESNNQLKELSRIQRLLTSKGHRIDFRLGSELSGNLKNLEEQIQNEIERTEKILQTENDFYHLDKEFESYLQISSEQLKSAQHQQDKGLAYQVEIFLFIFLFSFENL